MVTIMAAICALVSFLILMVGHRMIRYKLSEA